MPLISFDEQVRRDTAAMVGSSTAPGVRAVSYWTRGMTPSMDDPVRVLNARVQHRATPSEVVATGVREGYEIIALISKDSENGGLDLVDDDGYIRLDDQTYRIVAVENGHAVWRVIARLEHVNERSGRGSLYSGGMY